MFGNFIFGQGDLMAEALGFDNSFSGNVCYSSNDLNSNLKESLFNNLIWGIDDVCKFTSYAKGTIYNFVSRGEIPYHTRGRKKRLVFIPDEIISWFKGE